jgi:hypothetical protein
MASKSPPLSQATIVGAQAGGSLHLFFTNISGATFTALATTNLAPPLAGTGIWL